MRTACLDIGGTQLKRAVVGPTGELLWGPDRVPTPRPASPEAVMTAVLGGLSAASFQRCSVGFPGVVVDGIVGSAPNLDPSWVGVDLASAIHERLGVPCRVANDADVHGYGAVEGRGVEVVLTLGTGMGSALFVDGRLVPNLELGHHPLADGRTYEQLVGAAARDELGRDRWDEHVALAVRTVARTFTARRIWLGGGHAQDLASRLVLPEVVRIVSNDVGLLGGLALWR